MDCSHNTGYEIAACSMSYAAGNFSLISPAVAAIVASLSPELAPPPPPSHSKQVANMAFVSFVSFVMFAFSWKPKISGGATKGKPSMTSRNSSLVSTPGLEYVPLWDIL